MLEQEQEHLMIGVLVALIVILLSLISLSRKWQRSKVSLPPSETEDNLAVEKVFFASEAKLSILQPIRKRDLSQQTKQSFVEEKSQISLLQMFQTTEVQDILKQVTCLYDVSNILRKAGLETCHLIFGIDYTGSNCMQGKKTFNGKCLHHVEHDKLNPYQKVIDILGETLEPFHEKKSIPAYGFGDIYTRDHSVFSLSTLAPCQNFQDVLSAYNEMTPKIRLGGPTNFAPSIRKSIEVVKMNKGYHLMVIIADGQVTAEEDTTEAIIEASNWPLSIVVVGVGDGPWDTMKDLQNKLHGRRIVNFNFVTFNDVINDDGVSRVAFAVQALMHLPDQCKTINGLRP